MAQIKGGCEHDRECDQAADHGIQIERYPEDVRGPVLAHLDLREDHGTHLAAALIPTLTMAPTWAR